MDLNPQTATDGAEPAPAPKPPLSAIRYAIGYVVFAALLIGVILWAMHSYRGWIDSHQRSRERYAAERAIEALDKGDVDEARIQIELLANERPIYKGGLFQGTVSDVWEGAVLRDRVTIYEQLCARLLKAGMIEQARTLAWKSLFEYHIHSRTLELIIPWEMAALSAMAGNDWYTAFQAGKILAAHGADQIRTPANMDPVPSPENPDLFKNASQNIPPAAMKAMKAIYQQPAPGEIESTIETLDQARRATTNPAVANQLDVMLHELYLKSSKPERARQLLARKWGRDPSFMETYWKTAPNAPENFLTDREPSLIDYLWAERTPDTRLTLANFMDSFMSDPRVLVYDFTKLEPQALGYFNESNKFEVIGDSLGMFNNVAGSMELETNSTSYQIAIAYKGQQALGIGPILLVQIDDGPYIPVYCDSERPAIATADVNLPAGRHKISFVYLNDGGFSWPSRKLEEDRNLTLYRFALIQVKRPG